ncbi:MAG: DUF262 domain-containing protein [Bacteroidaceae bacterium]|nr:DUF262 domain-containing protein [Bacteroidaceae bacterium]
MKITEEEFRSFVEKEFPGKDFYWEYKDGHGYLQIQAGNGKKFTISDVHYEYYNGSVRIHIEGKNWWQLRQDLSYILNNHKELRGDVWQKRQNCQWILDNDKESGFNLFKQIRDIVEPELAAYEEGKKLNVKEESVSYQELGLDDLYSLNLDIPPYQRIYTWGDEQVRTLLDDIANIKLSKYFIGSVILHKQKLDGKEVFDIVDGQQRLVTTALIKFALDGNNISDDLSRFLNCEYASLDAQVRIAENLRYIQNYLSDKNRKEHISQNLSKLTFGVLTIKEYNSLDLAFTFFSNTNSKGKKLTDYDLLKPHHLRYIPSDLEDQQMHLSRKWDSMVNKERKVENESIANQDGREKISYIRVMELLLYRLRKWEQAKDGVPRNDYHIKKEFEAAPIIKEIPPFGEQFDFCEPIQGGQHFFAYVEQFIDKYNSFEEKTIIQENFRYSRTDQWYSDVIEALAFCYYLKFGKSYINEAIMSITRYVSIIRFRNAKAYKPTILKWVKDSRIVMEIRRSTSPTFFLAFIESLIDNPPVEPNRPEDASNGIRSHFLNDCCFKLTTKLMDISTVEYYKHYFTDRYGKLR